ncbi:MAG: hypothetical protein ABIJ33_03390 [Patescibacteria group bacterium]
MLLYLYMSDPVRRPPMPTFNRTNLSSKFGGGANVTYSFAQRNQERIMKAAQKRLAFKRASVNADQPVKAVLEKRGEMLAGEIGRLQSKLDQT